MEAPEDLGLKIYKTLIALYADQIGARIKCQFEFKGETYDFDTDQYPTLNSKETNGGE